MEEMAQRVKEEYE